MEKIEKRRISLITTICLKIGRRLSELEMNSNINQLANNVKLLQLEKRITELEKIIKDGGILVK